MNMSLALATLALGLAGVSAPALARTASDQPKVAPAVEAGAAIDPRADMRRVCVKDVVTGSRIPLKTCQSRAQWISQTGVDPLARH